MAGAGALTRTPGVDPGGAGGSPPGSGGGSGRRVTVAVYLARQMAVWVAALITARRGDTDTALVATWLVAAGLPLTVAAAVRAELAVRWRATDMTVGALVRPLRRLVGLGTGGALAGAVLVALTGGGPVPAVSAAVFGTAVVIEAVGAGHLVGRGRTRAVVVSTGISTVAQIIPVVAAGAGVVALTWAWAAVAVMDLVVVTVMCARAATVTARRAPFGLSGWGGLGLLAASWVAGRADQLVVAGTMSTTVAAAWGLGTMVGTGITGLILAVAAGGLTGWVADLDDERARRLGHLLVWAVVAAPPVVGVAGAAVGALAAPVVLGRTVDPVGLWGGLTVGLGGAALVTVAHWAVARGLPSGAVTVTAVAGLAATVAVGAVGGALEVSETAVVVTITGVRILSTAVAAGLLAARRATPGPRGVRR